MAAVIVTVILYLIIYLIYGNQRTLSPFSYLIAIPLLALLSVQFFLLFGSVSLKHSCNEAAAWIDVLVPEHSSDGSFSREDINEGVRQLVTAFPLASTLIDADDISLDKDKTLGEALTSKIQTYLNWYVVRRVAWSLGFIVLAMIGIIMIQPQVTGYHPRERRERRDRRRPTSRNRR